MSKAGRVSLFITIFLWANIVGAITYAHVAFFSSYLFHLPESTILINEDFGVRDERFWMSIHPFAIIFTIITLLLYRKRRDKFKYIAGAFGIYILVMISTAIYFVPELIEFAGSKDSVGVSAEQWQARGQMWFYASLVRGLFMYAGFILLLKALHKRPGRSQAHSDSENGKMV